MLRPKASFTGTITGAAEALVNEPYTATVTINRTDNFNTASTLFALKVDWGTGSQNITGGLLPGQSTSFEVPITIESTGAKVINVSGAFVGSLNVLAIGADITISLNTSVYNEFTFIAENQTDPLLIPNASVNYGDATIENFAQGSNTHTYESGNFAASFIDLAGNVEELEITGQNKAQISEITTQSISLTVFNIWYQTLNALNLAANSYIGQLVIFQCPNLKYIALPANFGIIGFTLSTCGLNSAQVDAQLAEDLRWYESESPEGFALLSLAGNAAPTAAGQITKAALQAYGITVLTA
jgi:hypothetical protein